MRMATYVPHLGGWIADVPQFFFKRSDGTVFVNKHVTACSVNPQTDFMEVRAGWSNYASAYLPGQSTMDINVTLGDFDADLFAVANAVSGFASGAVIAPVAETLTAEASSTNTKVTLTYTPAADTEISIRGLEKGTAVATGKFTVSDKVITFAAADVPIGTEVEVVYETSANDTNDPSYYINIDNTRVACGETVLKWPVYNSGNDCTEAGIIKYLIVRVFKTRVTTAPGFDTSWMRYCGSLFRKEYDKHLLNGEPLTLLAAA